MRQAVRLPGSPPDAPYSEAIVAAGGSLDDVVKVNAYLADIADFDAFSATYARFFAVPRPARTTVGTGLTGIVDVDAVGRSPGVANMLRRGRAGAS